MDSFIDQQFSSQEQQLKISDLSKSYLNETAKWGQFLSIVGFIGIGIMVLMGLVFSFSFNALQHLPMGNNMPAGFSFLFGLVYIVIGIIYFFPCLYLFRFSKKTKDALQLNNEESLTVAFSNQKSVFKFMGIFTVIVLGFYAIMFLIGILGLML